MASYNECTDLALRELDGCRDVLAGASSWTSPTPCDGWDCEALARHVGAVAWQQAEAFHRARVHVTEAPSWLAVTGDRDAALDAMSTARSHLADAFTSVTDPDRIVPLPFGQLPASVAAAGLVLEYGIHRADLERALLGAPDDHVDPAVATVVASLLPALLPFLAQKDPATPVTYRLAADTTTASMSWRDGAWHAEPAGEPVCEIRGSDAAISLLALGRIRPDHPALTVTDPLGAAGALPDHVRRL